MARVLISTQGWGVLQDQAGNSVSGYSVTLKNRDGSNATHYSARTGGTSSTASMTSSVYGTLDRWVEPGEYSLVVGADTYDVDATPGSVKVVLEAPLNVKDSRFGAAGDDSTDDSAAFQAAADLAGTATKGRLFIPAGGYRLANAQLSSGTSVIGEGVGATVLKLKNSAAAAASLPGGAVAYTHRNVITNKHGGSTGNNGITIRDITIDGNVSGSNAADEFYFGIALWAVRDVLIENVKCQNVRGEGILIGRNPALGQDTEDVHIRSVILENCGVDAGTGLARQGIAVTQCRRFTIRDVVADTIGSHCIDLEPDQSSQILEDFTIDGIHVTNANSAVALIGQSGGNIRRGRIGATTLRDGVDHSPSYVVLVEGADKITVDRPETDASTVTYLAWNDVTTPATNLQINGVGQVCRLSRNANQSLVSTVAAPVEWNVEDSDRDGSHDQTNATTRQRFKAVADGWYRTTATIRYSATTGTYRHVNLRKYNTSDAGETDCGTDRRPSGQAFQSYSWPAVFLRQGEYLRVWVEADAAIDVMFDGVASPVVTFEKVG